MLRESRKTSVIFSGFIQIVHEELTYQAFWIYLMRAGDGKLSISLSIISLNRPLHFGLRRFQFVFSVRSFDNWCYGSTWFFFTCIFLDRKFWNHRCTVYSFTVPSLLHLLHCGPDWTHKKSICMWLMPMLYLCVNTLIISCLHTGIFIIHDQHQFDVWQCL